MRIEKPESSNLPKKKHPLILIGIAAAVIGGVYYFSQSAQVARLPFLQAPADSNRPPVEIANFTGKPEYYSGETRRWSELQRGAIFNVGDRIRTGKDVKVDLKIEDQAILRLKEFSELQRPAHPFWVKQPVYYQLQLVRGLILASTGKKADHEKWLEISTPQVVASVRGTVFVVQSNPETKKSWVGVLRGKLEVRSKDAKGKTVVVQDMHKTDLEGKGPLTDAARISKDEWDDMKEAYELVQKSAAEEAEQLDLSLQAGGLFKNVFDHGTFFTPKVGYCWRNFEKNENGKVTLSVEYDVFPRGSFVGMYMKVRDMKIQDYEALQFKVSQVAEEGYPEAFRIEIKSKGQTLRAFTPKLFRREWQTMRFPLRATKDQPVSEITFVFSNDKAGEFTHGTLRFSDVELIPAARPQEEAKKPQEPKAKPAPAASKQKVSIAVAPPATTPPAPAPAGDSKKTEPPAAAKP